MPACIWAQPSLELEHKRVGNSKIKGSNASFRTSSNKIALHNKMLGFSYEQYNLSWRNNADLPPDLSYDKSDPLTHIKALRLSTKYPKPLSEKQMLIAGVSLGATYEKEMANSYGANLFAVVGVRIANGFSTSYGAIINYHPVRTLALPAVGLGYRQKEPLGLKGTLGFPKTSIAYGFNERWQMSAGVVFDSVITKLSKSSPISPSGYMEINAYQSDLTASYRLNKQLSIETSYRYTPIYQFTRYNTNRQKIARYHMKPANAIAIKLSKTF